MGAIINVVLNLIFTPLYGAIGAAVATAISYFVVWAFRYCQSKKYIKMRINITRDIVSYILLIMQSILILINGLKMYIFVGLVFVIICLLYLNDIILVINKFLKRGI